MIYKNETYSDLTRQNLYYIHLNEGMVLSIYLPSGRMFCTRKYPAQDLTSEAITLLGEKKNDL